jgi:alanine racemase
MTLVGALGMAKARGMSFDLRRPNCFVIDLQVVADNTRTIRERIGPKARFFATIKADAYGFGLLPVAKTVLEHGADSLTVVRLEDALALREIGITCPILVYAGYVLTADHVRTIETHNLTPTIHDRHSLNALAQYAARPIGVGIKVECGQERLGVPDAELPEFVRSVAASENLRLDVINTHPHVIDGNMEYLRWQFGRFRSALDAARPHFKQEPDCIFASSRVLVDGADMILSGVDPGQALFQLPAGLAPEGQKDRTPFKALSSRLIHVFDVKRDSYLKESPVKGARIGIVPIGYGDGLVNLNAGEALVRGKRVKFASSPSVEYARLDLTDCRDATVGDEVLFVGSQGEEILTPQEVMRHTNTPRVATLAMQVGQAVPRLYLQAKTKEAVR